MACGAMRRWSSGAGFAAASRDTRRFWARGRVLWTVRWGRRSGSSGEATCHRFPVGWREGDLDVPVCLLESQVGYRRVSWTGEEALLPDPGKQWPAPRTLSLWSSWRHLWLPSWPGLAADRSPRGCGCQQTVGFTLKAFASVKQLRYVSDGHDAIIPFDINRAICFVFHAGCKRGRQ